MPVYIKLGDTWVCYRLSETREGGLSVCAVECLLELSKY